MGLIPRLADDLLTLPSTPWKLATRPWTLLTYMFTHFSFRHILFNMLILYFSGKMLIEYLGEKRMLALYIYGGIGGGLLYIILYNISPILGAGSIWRQCWYHCCIGCRSHVFTKYAGPIMGDLRSKILDACRRPQSCSIFSA